MTTRKNRLFIVVGLFLLLAFGFQGLQRFRQMQETDPSPQRASITGTLVCLPHAPGVPPTKECAIGLRLDDGTHYVFDTMLMSSIPEPHQVGDRVSGNGVLTPIERLSTDHWRKYDVEGIFSVTDGFRVVR